MGLRSTHINFTMLCATTWHIVTFSHQSQVSLKTLFAGGTQ
ncbi:unnamed protein product [Allacma fusca]|uniref:Uncharacterized protein n=1 Tax=Allacma fusca TaxID=39272 RepID=A0A8J2KZ86_9HEXA|nr:unnamed protein product [Allacma fusca]